MKDQVSVESLEKNNIGNSTDATQNSRNTSDDIAISVSHVSMHFNMASERIQSLKEYAIRMAQHKLFFTDFVALDDITFDVKKGEVFGIVGTNGSGKSTMLKIISGILEPTKGEVITKGKISPLIELGAGFDGELTARENIFLNGAVLGYDKEFLEEKFTSIVDFADLWDFLDMPIKNYSSGMIARIAFAVATLVKPDILIVDEILSVGDFLFQQKCERRIKELMEGGTTVLIVSHNIAQIESLCDRVLWIEKGKQKMLGSTFQVCQAYRNLQNELKEEEKANYQVVAHEKCHVCGEIVDFRDEPGMTYKSASYCSRCGTYLKTSDLMGAYFKSVYCNDNGSIEELGEKFNGRKVFLCEANGGLSAALKDVGADLTVLEGNVQAWIDSLDNIESSELINKKFDVIVLQELLMYVADPLYILKKMASMLSDDGVLLITMPIYEGKKTSFSIDKEKKIFLGENVIKHLWGSDTIKLISGTGYEVEEMKCHTWYSPKEQRNPVKEYNEYISTHPFYFYKFNSISYVCRVKNKQLKSVHVPEK